MHAPALALSVLGVEIKALGFRRGAQTAQWESPRPWDETEDLAALLREAYLKTQPDGREVSMVVAHPRLNDQVVEVPPAKGWTLERLLERQAQSSKTFPGPAVWSRQPALPTKKNNAALLHLLPKATLDQLNFACQKAHLRLVRVLPTSAVLIGQLKQLPLEKDELALLVATTGPSTTIVIGRKDGRVALGRVLANSWSTALDRVWVDLTRSIGFAEQQCGVPVNSVWLFGPGAQEQVASMQAFMKVPVHISPVEYTPFYWTEQASRLPDKNDGNLVSLEVRQAPQRRRLLTATMVILLLLVLMCLGAAAGVEVARQLELSSVREIERLTARLEERKKDWEKRYADTARKKQIVRLVTDESVPPVPIWFLGYLGEVVPDELVLTDLRVNRTNEHWSLHIAGIWQPGDGQTNLSAGSPAQSLAALTNSLAAGPFRVQVNRSVWHTGGPVTGQPIAGSVARSRAGGDESGASDHFWVDGVIR